MKSVLSKLHNDPTQFVLVKMMLEADDADDLIKLVSSVGELSSLRQHLCDTDKETNAIRIELGRLWKIVAEDNPEILSGELLTSKEDRDCVLAKIEGAPVREKRRLDKNPLEDIYSNAPLKRRRCDNPLEWSKQHVMRQLAEEHGTLFQKVINHWSIQRGHQAQRANGPYALEQLLDAATAEMLLDAMYTISQDRFDPYQFFNACVDAYDAEL